MDDEMTAIQALKEGAQDYLVKGRTDSSLLRKSLLYAYERNRLLLDLEENSYKLAESYAKLKEGAIEKSREFREFAEKLAGPARGIKEAADRLKIPGGGAGLDVIQKNAEAILDAVDNILSVENNKNSSGN